MHELLDANVSAETKEISSSSILRHGTVLLQLKFIETSVALVPRMFLYTTPFTATAALCIAKEYIFWLLFHIFSK
jgi:hypothetical protein